MLLIMRNLKLILAYDGTEFSGWQVQPSLPTIQGSLASAIGRLTGETSCRKAPDAPTLASTPVPRSPHFRPTRLFLRKIGRRL